MPIKRARRILSRPQQEVAAVERIERVAAAKVVRARIVAALEHRRANATKEQLKEAQFKRNTEQVRRATMLFGVDASHAVQSMQAFGRALRGRPNDVVFLDSVANSDFEQVELRTLAQMYSISTGRTNSRRSRREFNEQRWREFQHLYYDTPEPTPCEHQWQLHQPHALHGRNRHRGAPQRRCRLCGEIRNH